MPPCMTSAFRTLISIKMPLRPIENADGKTPAMEPYPPRYGLTNSFARSTVAFGVA